MAIDMTHAPIPKGEPRRTRKGRQRRQEGAVKQSVRAQLVERDGPCRVMHPEWQYRDDLPGSLWPHECTTVSEWAHLKGHRRSQTRGMAPNRRHTTTHSLMLCQELHRLEEQGILKVEYLTKRGCDGPLRLTVER